jgi:dihydroneopterin aldolase
MADLDCIKLSNMGFYAFHGTTKAEKSVGQRFFLDVYIYLNLRRAGQSDNVKDTVDYEKVYNLIRNMMNTKKYNLIEALAEDVANVMFSNFHNIERIQVSVRKPNVPLTGILDCVEMTIHREKGTATQTKSGTEPKEKSKP